MTTRLLAGRLVRPSTLTNTTGSLATKSVSSTALKPTSVARIVTEPLCMTGSSQRRLASFFSSATKAKQVKAVPQYGQPTWMTHPHLMKQGEITPGLTATEYELRRTLLMESLPKGSIVISTSYRTRYMTNNIFYPFHQNTDFYYLCGFNEPDSALVLEKDDSTRGYKMTMFVAPKNTNIEMWEGPRTGLDAAKEIFGADEATDANLFRYRIVDMASRYENVYFDYPGPAMFMPMDIAKKLHNRPDSDIMSSTKNLSPLIQELRVVKSEAEIKIMRQAGEISGKSFIETMKFTNPQRLEHQVYAKFDFECRMRGSQMMAYVPVVAGGTNALTMHYVNNDQPLKDGDLLLMDAGGEWNSYASDITRTWPVNGKFTEAQKDLYEVVLHANKECIKLCTEEKGLSLNQIHDVSMRLTKEGLSQLGIKPLAHDVDRRLYPHHVGHYLGMDVHDTGDISRSRPLKEGMVITIEPGLYIPCDPAYPEKYQGIGIRIEDNVAIGKTVPYVLSVTAPKEIVDIEYCCASGKE
ncbi:Xaa-Pro aminopeptidase 3 [Dissophora globulifera]|nr:Xaa-Pro aminopeptidase 3 [Dissophora globulifera]